MKNITLECNRKIYVTKILERFLNFYWIINDFILSLFAFDFIENIYFYYLNSIQKHIYIDNEVRMFSGESSHTNIQEIGFVLSQYLASGSGRWRRKILFRFSSFIFQYHTRCCKGHFYTLFFFLYSFSVFPNYTFSVVSSLMFFFIWLENWFMSLFTRLGRLSFNQRHFSLHNKFTQ